MNTQTELAPATETIVKHSLTVIVPAYNEETSLEKIVRETCEVVNASTEEFEILIVNDGSTDGTGEVAERLAVEIEEVQVAHHRLNQGSGMAIRTGIEQATCELVMYVPADNQFNLKEIGAFMEASSDADIVLGVRLERSDYSWFRLLSSWTFIRLTNFLFEFNYRDVNWVHLWRRKIFEEIRPRSKGVFLLEEILVLTARNGFNVVEIDSEYQPRIAGKPKGCTIRSILVAIYEILRLWFDLKRLKT